MGELKCSLEQINYKISHGPAEKEEEKKIEVS